MEKTIRTIRKNQREEIRIGLSEFHKDGVTHDMVGARVFYDNGAEYRPGRNGLNLKIEHLPALIEGLQAAADKARAAGLLTDSEPEGAPPTPKPPDGTPAPPHAADERCRTSRARVLCSSAHLGRVHGTLSITRHLGSV
jgi:hypothetical protein